MTNPRSIVRLLVATACAAALLTAPAVAGDAILKVIPKDSIAFAVVDNLGNADEVCAELGKATQFPIPSPTMILKQATGLDDSLNLDDGMAVVFYKGEMEVHGVPPMFIILPVKDYEKQLAKLDAEEVTKTIKKVTVKGTEVLVASKDGYMVVGQEANQAALEGLLESKENISEEMKSWKTWAAKNVVYGVVTNYGLKEFMKEGIGSLEGTIESFAQLGQSSPQLDQFKKTLGIYLMVMKGIRDSANQVGVGLSTTDSGTVLLSTRCDTMKDSDLATMLNEVKALPTDPMAVLPAGPFVFAAGGPIPQKAVAMLMEVTQGMSGSQLGLDEEENAKMTKLSIDALKGVLGQGMVFGTPAADAKSLLTNICAVMWVEDADAYLASYRKQVKEMNDLFAKAENPMMEMEVEEKTIDGKNVLVVTTDMSGMFSTPELAPVAGIVKSFYGEDLKIVVYVAKVSDTLVVSAAVDEKELAKVMEVAKTQSGSLADTSGVKELAASFPKDAQWFFYWSPAGTVDMVNWIIGKLPEQLTANMPFEQLPAFPECPPIGVAAKIGNGSVEKTFVFTPATIRSMVTYAMQLRMMGAH